MSYIEPNIGQFDRYIYADKDLYCKLVSREQAISYIRGGAVKEIGLSKDRQQIVFQAIIPLPTNYLYTRVNDLTVLIVGAYDITPDTVFSEQFYDSVLRLVHGGVE